MIRLVGFMTCLSILNEVQYARNYLNNSDLPKCFKHRNLPNILWKQSLYTGILFSLAGLVSAYHNTIYPDFRTSKRKVRFKSTFDNRRQHLASHPTTPNANTGNTTGTQRDYCHAKTSRGNASERTSKANANTTPQARTADVDVPLLAPKSERTP